MLRAGRYYIGDLSVVLSQEEVKYLEQFPSGYCSLPDGTTIWKHVVKNGVYRTSIGNNLSVSIGVVGVIPLREEYNNKVYVVNINKFGMVYSCFDRDIDIKNDRGDIYINDLVIDTNNDGLFGGSIDEPQEEEVVKVNQI